MTEPNVSTVDKPDLQQFTPEQIDEWCETLESLETFPEGNAKTVRIIRQLQWACGMYHKTFVQPAASGEA